MAIALVAGGARAAVPALAPDGGGAAPDYTDVHDPRLEAEIAARTEAALARLAQAGRLPPARPKVAAGLSWPLALQPGPGIDWHGISNFVDLDPAFPSRVRDFECRTRTYDNAQGYNHNGTDFFTWPFAWTLMDAGAIDVVAAAPGTLLVKVDGNPDRSCSFSAPDTANLVVVRHEDGRIARYLHLKTGSVTAKQEGDAIALGEPLGKVGSSGVSTGPHLHFELREAATGAIVDPFAGQCNLRATAWAQQRPYYESRLNRVATHRAAPAFPGCPATSDTPNLADEFAPGATVFYASYFRDQRHGQLARMRVLRPDASLYREWTFDSAQQAGTPAHFNASYFFWSNALPIDAPAGRWTFEATFEGITLREPFTVTGAATCVAPVVALAGPAQGAAGASHAFTATVTAPGPVRLEWDVDGDGAFDRTVHGVARDASLAATYPSAAAIDVRVRATTATGCSAEARHAIRIDAPDLVATAAAPTQVCGDGDALVEPGERWQVPVNLRNAGSALANGVAVFARADDNKAPLRVLAPAQALPDLAHDAAATLAVGFEIESGAACGERLVLDYVGSVDDAAHTLRSVRVLDTTLGAGGAAGSCSATASGCDAGIGDTFVPRDGLYSSFVRFGNGIASFAIPTPGGTVFGGQWFTGRRDRTPEWLIVQGPLVGRQADAPVLRFRQSSASPFAAAGEVVGRALISYLSPTEYVATWSVDGIAAGEKLKLLYGTTRPEPNRTGSWFAPTEAGWGEAIDDHILPNGSTEQVIVNYYYDRAGRAVWTLGGGPVGGGEMPHNAFFVHCPACAALPDFTTQAKPAGSVTTSYDGTRRGTYATRIDRPLPLEGSWQRAALPIERISEPQ
ncbi:MAG TPA: M23 family metallopeptidase [Candidatus Saccharimonadia bacterium]|nr:M23 family metallopeptidase [Candidatus Saccharimonadia bacterium]